MWHGKDDKNHAGGERAIVALCFLGASFMGYLTYLHFKTSPGTFCDFGAGFSCDLVNKSIYAEAMGVPLSLMGLAYFIGVAALMLKRAVPDRLRIVQIFTVFSLIFSLHLTYIEIFVLGSVCVFCEASKAVMLAILALSTRSLVADRRPLRLEWLVAAVAAGMFFTAAARFVQTA